MSKRTAYFASGAIFMQEGGKAAFKRNIRLTQSIGEGKVWFRPCKAWKEAVQASNDAWARARGYASYEGYCFTQNILKG